MGSDIALSASLRQNLLSLQTTTSLLDRTTLRLNTGLEVNSALDDPLNFFTSQSLTDRAGDLERLLDGIGQSISAIEQSNNGVTALEQLVIQSQSITQQARDEVADGQVQAEIIGSSDISNEEDLASINGANGITGNTLISFSLGDPDNPGTPLFDGLDAGNATLQAIGQIDFGGLGVGTADFATATVSSDELITAINDINDQLRAEGIIGNEDVIEASLDEDGQLNVRSLNGGDLEINFFSDFTGGVTGTTANNTSDNILVAQALGFGNIANVLDDGSVNGATQNQDVVITALGQPSLLSNTLFAEDPAGSGLSRIAQASDQLTTLFVNESVITGAGGDELFLSGGLSAGTFNANDTLTISVNGTTNAVAEVSLGGTPPPTIQDLIDQINNTATLNTQIEASFDTTTGQIAIRSIDPSVETVDVAINDGAGTNGLVSQLGFGPRGSVNTDAAGGGRFEERLRLANAASRLAELEQDYDSLREQIDALVADSDFRGTNLLLGDTLLTIFNEDRTSFLETEGAILNAAGLGLIAADFSRIDTIEDFEARGRDALSTVRGFGSTLANDLGVIEARENFTEVTITTLSIASDKLVLADQNEEGANLLALQTRQQLGITSLSLSSQSQQGILQLF